MRRMSIAVLVVLTAAGAAFAAPAAKSTEWAEGPVKVLMTREEVKQWQSVQTDEQAVAFIELFWARRDPTPATPHNEFRDEIEKRIALADEHFTTKRTRGALTDRGKTLIVLGAPFQTGSKGAARGAGAANNPQTRTGAVDIVGPRGASAMLTWTYSQERKPKFIKTKDLEILFVDDAGDGQWQFAITPRSSPEAILEEAKGYLITSPHLTEPPVFEAAIPVEIRTGSLKTPALRNAYEQFRGGEKAQVGPALLTWGQFVTPEGEIFVPVQLFVPAGAGIEAGRKLTFFGVVENAAGQIVQVYEDPVTLAASLRDAYVDKSLSLQPGTYKATLGLADKDQVVAMTRTEMTIENLDASESAISQMILSNNAFALPEAQLLTDPFAFGGLKVVPKADAVFSQKDDIWYFFELRNPGIADSGAPKIQAKIDIEGKTEAEKPVKMSLPWQEIETLPLKGVKNHYGLGMSFPLKDFAPGRYTVKIRVMDALLKKTYESQKEFEIRF